MSDPTAGPPLINTMIEDILAHAPNEEARAMYLSVLINVATEYLARQAGKGRTRDLLRDLDRFVRDAQPMPPWPE